MEIGTRQLPSVRLLCIGLVLLGCFSVVGCDATSDSGSEGEEPAASIAAATATPNQSAYRQAWQEGPHAQTYSLEKGPNTYCARCHSPGNWDPAATIDPPPNCVSCKFPFEAVPRMATGNPLVPEEEWQSIGCDVCHRVNEDGVVEAQIAWHDPVSGYYETVADATALCAHCHRDTETLRHNRDVGQAHAGYVCTDCHDAHSAVASCTQQGCHDPGQPDWQKQHDEHHDALACVACHDAAGLQVGPLEDGSLWMTFRTTELLGRANTEPYQSHQLQRDVNCRRCHFPDNPWDLLIVDDDA